MSEKPTLKLTVSDADDDGIFVASDNVSTVYGSGESVMDAVSDYLSAVRQEHRELTEDKSILGKSLKLEVTVLGSLLQRWQAKAERD